MFESGDKVKVINPDDKLFEKVGIVVDSDDDIVTVKMSHEDDSISYEYFFESELDLVIE